MAAVQKLIIASNSVGNVEMEVNEEELRYMLEKVRNVIAQKSRQTVLMNEYTFSAN